MALTGLDWNSSVAFLSNISNPNLFFSGPTSREDALMFYGKKYQDVVQYVNKEVAYFTRGNTYITVLGVSGSFWNRGGYDPIRRIFISPAYFNLGVEGTDTGGNEVFHRYGAVSLLLHEAFPGHGQQVPLSQEVDCQISANATAPSSFVEGWALYTENMGFWLNVTSDTPNGMYTDRYQQLGYWNMNMLRSNRLVEDTGLHSNLRWSYDQAWQYMASNGFIDSAAQSETARYVTMPGQALSYMLGRLKLLEMRAYSESTLGANFDPREFNMVLTKFGGGTMADLDLLVHTYVSIKLDPQNEKDHKAEFGHDLIEQMFSSCLPVVGYGR